LQRNYYFKTEEYPTKNFPGTKQLGWIADEVEDIVPEIVVEDEEGYKHIAYSHATPLLAEAIKELRTELMDMFTEKIDNLVTQLNDMIDQNHKLQLRNTELLEIISEKLKGLDI